MATYVLIDAAPFAAQDAAPLLVRSEARDLPPGGEGYLAGSYPDGITRIEGVPGPATIRVLYRPAGGAAGDGIVVAEVESAVDGTWLVTGLNPTLVYDVVCRKAGYNDMIYSNVSPATA